MLPEIESALHASVDRALTTLATLLPALSAFVLAVLIGVLLGVLLGYVLKRLLTAVKLDERMRSASEGGGLGWSSIRSPSLLISQVAVWGCVIAGTVIGVSAFAAAYGSSALLEAALLPYVARFVGAVLIVLAGMVVARFLARSVLIEAVNMHLHYARLLSQGVKWLVMVLSFAMALDHLSVGGKIVDLAFGILFGGIVLTLSLAVGLGTPDLIRRTLDPHATDPRPVEPEERRFAEEPPAGNVRHF
jgi:hypothetical protein